MLNLALRIIRMCLYTERFTDSSSGCWTPTATRPDIIPVAFIGKWTKTLAQVQNSSFKKTVFSQWLDVFLQFCTLWVYRDEVSSTAVDVNTVIIHSDHFIGLCHEEGCTAELRTLCCEGEPTLHCNHVQASCEPRRSTWDANQGTPTDTSCHVLRWKLFSNLVLISYFLNVRGWSNVFSAAVSNLRKGLRNINSSGVSLLSSELKNEYSSSLEISLFLKKTHKKKKKNSGWREVKRGIKGGF